MFGMFFLVLISYWGFLVLIFLLDPSRTNTPKNVTCHPGSNKDECCRHTCGLAGDSSDNPIEISDDETISADEEDSIKENSGNEDCSKKDSGKKDSGKEDSDEEYSDKGNVELHLDHNKRLPTQHRAQGNRASVRPRKTVRYDDCNEISVASPVKSVQRPP
jgi:hypothetical protein